jgi:amino acid transporter
MDLGFNNQTDVNLVAQRYSLPYGGPVAMNWGWFLAGGLILFIGLSMAELASSMPTS